jgi:hypothetical protein
MPTKKRAGTKRRSIPKPKRELGERITVENVNVPGHTTRLDAPMYRAMQAALLTVLPSKEPGLTQDEMRRAVVPHLPKSLFPGGAKAGWWAKSVQLDLEAKGVIAREATKPLRWHRKPVR